MRALIPQLPNEYREVINIPLLKKEWDKPIEAYVFDALKGFEILPNIIIHGYEWDPCEENYDANDHIVHRNANKNKTIKSISETRCGVMYVDVEIRGKDKSGNKEIRYLKKPIIIPIEDENGYYLIKGKKCYLIYQLVDKMLYPSFGAVTVKSLMPICVKTSKDIFHDIDGKEYTIPTYSIQIFKSAINVLLLYSHLCITKTLQFMEVSRFIRIDKLTDPIERDENLLKFTCGNSSNCVIVVGKEAFDQEVYIRSIVGCLINLFEEFKVQYCDLDNWDFWMIMTGGRNTVSRGKYQHIFFNRLLDEVTRKELPINDFDKQDIYHLLRWIIENYHLLWAKDNLSVINKRLRCHEYISTYITAEVSKRINRLVTLGDKATVHDFENAFKFPEDIFITKLYSSGVLRYAENDSDIDFPMKVKFTAKGPNSLGIKDSRRISLRNRKPHPRNLGYFAMDDISQSDPGRSGSLSPYNDMKSMYFDDSKYENKLHYRLSQLGKETAIDDIEMIDFVCDSEEAYNRCLDTLCNLESNKVVMFSSSNEPWNIVVRKDPREGYRKFNEDEFVAKEET